MRTSDNNQNTPPEKTQHTQTYISKAEVTTVRNTKQFLSKKSTSRSGHSNLEKISRGEHDKDLIKSQMITEMHKMKSPSIIFHNSRTRRYQKTDQLLL